MNKFEIGDIVICISNNWPEYHIPPRIGIVTVVRAFDIGDFDLVLDYPNGKRVPGIQFRSQDFVKLDNITKLERIVYGLDTD